MERKQGQMSYCFNLCDVQADKTDLWKQKSGQSLAMRSMNERAQERTF